MEPKEKAFGVGASSPALPRRLAFERRSLSVTPQAAATKARYGVDATGRRRFRISTVAINVAPIEPDETPGRAEPQAKDGQER